MDAEATCVLDRAWELARTVSVRPEPFGAMLYDLASRRLVVVRDPRLPEVLRNLASAPSARAACSAAGVRDDRLGAYERALASLAAAAMVQERVA